MASIAIGTVPATGHVAPLLPIARALVAAGHHVRWLAGSKQRARIEATGASFEPYRATRDVDETRLDDFFPGRAQLTGLPAIKHDIMHVFLDPGIEQLHDLEALHAEAPIDVLIADVAFLGAQLYHERTRTPLAVINVAPLFVSSRDVAPIGLALHPTRSSLGSVRNRLLQAAIERVLLRDVCDHYHRLRVRAGLSPRAWFIDSHERASVLLHPSIPGLEYPRRDLPDNVHFIGLLPPDSGSAEPLPAWSEELHRSRPVVHVTQGTIANVRPDLIAPTLAGLADEDVWVVVTTGHRDVASLALGALPDNATVTPFLPHSVLLPRCAAFVTNGGFGGVQTALSHGVPVVVAGKSEEKPEVAARVSYSGAGLDLKTGTPRPAQVQKAVGALLRQPSFRARANELANEYRRYDALTLALQHIEALT